MRPSAGPGSLALVLAALQLLAGCQRRESVEAARDRSRETFLSQQIVDLKKLIAKAEGGQLVRSRIAIGSPRSR
jgi:hypothetical protein